MVSTSQDEVKNVFVFVVCSMCCESYGYLKGNGKCFHTSFGTCQQMADVGGQKAKSFTEDIHII